jgi:parallel beta-helix repeat protein
MLTLAAALVLAATPAASTTSVIELKPGDTLAAALAHAHPGDRVLIHAGDYPREQIQARFADYVTVEAAPGETATFAGLAFKASDHLRLRRLHVAGTLLVEESTYFDLVEMDLDAGRGDGSALHILTKGKTAATNHVRVSKSRIAGGGRTIFILTHFRPSAGWNGELEFTDNELHCGTRCCFQLSGARDTVISGNRVVETRAKGILLAGATRIRITRNRLENGSGPAIHIGTPGKEWDPYQGIENMISSDVVAADNVIRNWKGPAVQLDGCRGIELRGNTVENGGGLVTHRRSPTDLAGQVILVGNSDVRLRGNKLPGMEIAEGDPAPVSE